MPKENNTYECGVCHGIFGRTGDWSEEASVAEMGSVFGELPDEDRMIVCDDCYNDIMPRMHNMCEPDGGIKAVVEEYYKKEE